MDLASHGGLLVVVGGSSTGKTRALYEAIRAELPDWRLLHPAGSVDLANAVLAGHLPRSGVVIWLDEAQHYLTGPDRLTIGEIRVLLNPDQPMVLVATMWPQWYERLTSPPPAGAPLAEAEDAEEIDPHRHSRQILTTAARVVRLVSFNKAECARAETYAGEDPRLATASQDSHYGFTEVLAAAPQLVDRFEHAANPYAKAIMTAAIDYRRLGHNAPLTAELLQTAAVGYLTEQQIATAPTDWFATAIDYATGLLHGATSSLIPVPGTSMGTIIGYTIADYLLQYGQAARRDIPPPTSTWDAGVNHLTDLSVRLALAREASRRELYGQAELLATPAAESGIPLAMIILARSLQRIGLAEEAEDWYRRAAENGKPQGMLALARWLERARPAEAEQWYRRAAETGDHDAILVLANRLKRAGEAELAEKWYRRAADTNHPHGMMALARWLERAGQAEADDWYRHAAETGDHDAMVVLARRLERVGLAEEAEEWYRRAAGTGNLAAMMALARWLERAGPAEAEEWYRRAAKAGNPEAMVALADWLEAGQAEDAEDWYRHAAETGNPNAMMALASFLEHAAQAEAEEWYRRAAESGNSHGMLALADWLHRAGQAEAEGWYRRAAETGNPVAILRLPPGQIRHAKRLGRVGRADKAEKWNRRAAEAGNLKAMWALADRLERAGQAEVNCPGVDGDSDSWKGSEHAKTPQVPT